MWFCFLQGGSALPCPAVPRPQAVRGASAHVPRGPRQDGPGGLFDAGQRMVSESGTGTTQKLVKFKVRKFPRVPKFPSSHVTIHRFPNSQVLRFLELKVSRFPALQGFLSQGLRFQLPKLSRFGGSHIPTFLEGLSSSRGNSPNQLSDGKSLAQNITVSVALTATSCWHFCFRKCCKLRWPCQVVKM